MSLIKEKLREIVKKIRMGNTYVPYKDSYSDEEALVAIMALVVSTIPEVHPGVMANPTVSGEDGFRSCRGQMLETWTEGKA